ALAGGALLDVHAELDGEARGADVGAFGAGAADDVAAEPVGVLGLDRAPAAPAHAQALDRLDGGGPPLVLDLGELAGVEHGDQVAADLGRSGARAGADLERRAAACCAGGAAGGGLRLLSASAPAGRSGSLRGGLGGLLL